MQPTPPVDVEGLAKTIRESERDVEQLELARSEDRAMIRELEIGILKGLWASLWSQGAPEGLIHAPRLFAFSENEERRDHAL